MEPHENKQLALQKAIVTFDRPGQAERKIIVVTDSGNAQGMSKHKATNEQVIEALERVLPHLADRLGAVRLPGGVAEVENRLVRQLVDHRPGHGESTEA